MILHDILAALALLSLGLTLWQWLAARRFPLHRRVTDKSFAPAVTLLKPLKGADEHTEACLRRWFAQDYAGEIQILFGVASTDDPACVVARKLLGEFPQRDAELVVCGERLGANAKVSKLAQLQRRAKHDVLVISDADVFVPPDAPESTGARRRKPDRPPKRRLTRSGLYPCNPARTNCAENPRLSRHNL